MLIQAACWLALGFACGSVPFGYLVARAHRIDLRTVGSGNIGATNVWRALGWRWGVTVLLLDALKGWAPVALWLYVNSRSIAPLLLSSDAAVQAQAQLHSAWHAPVAMLAGLAAILGHTFTPWLKFRGGKGAATGLGVVLALYGWWSLVPLGVFALALLAARMVSLGSMLGGLSLAVISFAVPALRPYWPFGAVAAVLVLWTHRSNIARIIAGTEARVGRKKAPAA